MQLSPNESYPITYGIGNHLDTATYYVQTKIYNSDNVLLDTVNLTDQGGNNFLKMWKVPYDNVYQRGKWIYMVTSVYTDSNYTTKSTKYSDDYSGAILIQERLSLSNLASIGGGGIDYKELRKVLKEEISGTKKDKKEYSNKDLVEQITNNISNIIPQPQELPEIKPQEVDLTGVEMAIGNNIVLSNKILDELKSKPVSEIIFSIQSLYKTLEKEISKIKENMDKAINEKNLNLNIGVRGENINTKITDIEQENTNKSDYIKKLKRKYKL